jgi:small subunit ribosomal protein S20
LANTKSAIKNIRVSARKARRNRLVRSRARTFVKKTKRLIDAGEIEEARALAIQATSALDRAAEKGIIHKNAAARKKSRLMKKLNQAQSTPA